MTRVRKNVWGLGAGWNDTLLWYARAVRSLQSRPLTDQTSWLFLAAIHGIHPVVWRQFGLIDQNTLAPPVDVQRRFWNQCQHQSWYFLPWHRGYLAAFEEIVREAVVSAGGPEDWALPYWNYSDSNFPNARTIPDAFELPTLPDGSANPLRVQRRFGEGTTPIRLDPAFVTLAALQNDLFPGGESDVPPGFGGPETLFHHGPESETTNGGLESLPHNVIHGAIGGVAPGGNPNDWRNFGLMSMPMTAALDPIFWLHHANIDRLWNVWLRDTQEQHVNPDQSTWLDGPADREFVMPTSSQGEWTFTARDVLDTTALPLEYIYDDEMPPIVELRVERRLNRLGARVDFAGESEGAIVGSGRTPELIGASDGPVRVTGSTDAAVRLDPSSTQALRNSIDLVSGAAVSPPAEPARVFLKLEGIRGTSDAAIYHVYIGLPPNADPADYRERLAGTVSLFGISAASDLDGPTAGSGINQVLEITEIVDALHLSGDDLNRLSVRFVPATAAVAGANFSIARMSVFKLGE
jgi:tyrosinase